MRLLARTLLATVGALAVPGGVLHAQAVDYAALQETLGEPVTTSVTGKPQRSSAAPASIVIITRDQIARSPARSVPDLLKAYAGVDVNRWTAGQSDVAVRGGVQPYNARLLVLVDGRQVYLDHYGMTDWNLLGVPLDAVQQIELVRGPASALFGFNAASGVVNIITVDPSRARQASITAEGGTHGYSRLSGMAATPLGDRLAVRLAGEHDREDERRIPATIGQPAKVGGVTADAVSGTLIASPDATTRAELNGGWSRNRQLEFLPSELLSEQMFRTETAGLRVDHDTGWGSLNAQTYANWLTADFGVNGVQGGALIGGDSRIRNRIIVAKAASLARISTVDTVRIGLEYRSNQLYSGDAFSPRVGYQVAAGEAMADLHPLDRVALSIAGRIDHLWLGQGGAPLLPAVDALSDYRRTFTRLSFNAALLVQVGTGGQLRLNGGRGLQSPSLIDLGLRLPVASGVFPLPLYTAGDPNMAPSTVWSGEIGYGQRFASGFKIDVTAFVTRITDAIGSPGDLPAYSIRILPTPILVTRFVNVGSFSSRGVSIAASGHLLERLGWQANYTWTHVGALPAETPPFQVALAPGKTTPRHVASVALDYAGARWFGAATARYTSATRQFAFDPALHLLLFPVAQAVGIDARIGYHLTPHADVYAAGENLSDAAGAAGSPIPADRRLRLGLRFAL